ncbi:glycerol-3-phosphate dehydrogenase C-terminal domain-containing protein, partial [Microtetraspora niveoalba]|uniref:glycerol-3-phosphate dehydrogenase C-terminal domain-containing protein n=1 Tax=Microtetraspora niveoalba TaxID=46175 RepID=UPI000B08AA53
PAPADGAGASPNRRSPSLPGPSPDGRSRRAASPGDPPAHLVARYGWEARAVQDLARRDPALGETVAAGITRAELVWAVLHEGALDAGDLLDRRTRIGLVPEDREAALPAAEAALALGG